MALKVYRPVNNSMRQLVLVDRSELWKGRPVKKLTEGLRKTGGRNNQGRITTRHIGGGHKQLYRTIDFKRAIRDIPGKVERLEYDPNRTAYLALISYTDGRQAYILAPQRLKAGDTVIAGDKVDVKPGNAMPLKNMPAGTIIYNVEMRPGRGGQMARSAGTFAQLVGRDNGKAQIKVASGEVRTVPEECWATIGAVSNPDHINVSLSKAGRHRWMGVRPTVRGVAMNPIDHPHGGGEGRTSGGRHPVTPWGKGTKGTKTRKNKRTDHVVIQPRPRHRKAR
jgi:large subunit ribosomal protein L2